MFRIPFGTWVENLVEFITEAFGGLFDVIRAVFGGLYDAVDWVFTAPPFWIVITVVIALGIYARGWVFGIAAGAGLFFISSMNQWDNAMNTLALTIVAAVLALVISIPIGIWAARSRAVSATVKPILDFLQTMPAFVYLIPAIILFHVGVVPGIVATIAFSLAPGVRLTELGIRGVDKEIVEAGHAFGSSPGRILRQIQLPLAMPTIMAGVNQVIMLSLSMVVIASMVGAEGLGLDIVRALQSIDVGLGAEAGVAVVILAIVLDRLTATLGGKRRGWPASPTRKSSIGSSRIDPRSTEPQPVDAMPTVV
jgi:ABC-type proline/glycine betaine transport system permease subunit